MSRGVVEHRCFYVMGWNRGRAHDAPSHIGALESPGGGGEDTEEEIILISNHKAGPVLQRSCP